jgi:hypothetical protein
MGAEKIPEALAVAAGLVVAAKATRDDVRGWRLSRRAERIAATNSEIDFLILNGMFQLILNGGYAVAGLPCSQTEDERGPRQTNYVLVGMDNVPQRSSVELHRSMREAEKLLVLSLGPVYEHEDPDVIPEGGSPKLIIPGFSRFMPTVNEVSRDVYAFFYPGSVWSLALADDLQEQMNLSQTPLDTHGVVAQLRQPMSYQDLFAREMVDGRFEGL